MIYMFIYLYDMGNGMEWGRPKMGVPYPMFIRDYLFIYMGIFLSHGGAYLSIFVSLSIWGILKISIDTYMFIYSICLFIVIYI
jgi:hypothetical protein